jgi:hypothetical protein
MWALHCFGAGKNSIQRRDLHKMRELELAILVSTASTVLPMHYLKALFTSRVFEGMDGYYFVFRNFPDRLFTSLGFE